MSKIKPDNIDYLRFFMENSICGKNLRLTFLYNHRLPQNCRSDFSVIPEDMKIVVSRGGSYIEDTKFFRPFLRCIPNHHSSDYFDLSDNSLATTVLPSGTIGLLKDDNSEIECEIVIDIVYPVMFEVSNRKETSITLLSLEKFTVEDYFRILDNHPDINLMKFNNG